MENPELERKLLFILHTGIVEARLLALARKDQQLFHWADAFEHIPWYMNRMTPEHLEAIRKSLEVYTDRYAGTTPEYLKYLSGEYPIENF